MTLSFDLMEAARSGFGPDMVADLFVTQSKREGLKAKSSRSSPPSGPLSVSVEISVSGDVRSFTVYVDELKQRKDAVLVHVFRQAGTRDKVDQFAVMASNPGKGWKRMKTHLDVLDREAG